jgi:hypothetical protein
MTILKTCHELRQLFILLVNTTSDFYKEHDRNGEFRIKTNFISINDEFIIGDDEV